MLEASYSAAKLGKSYTTAYINTGSHPCWPSCSIVRFSSNWVNYLRAFNAPLTNETATIQLTKLFFVFLLITLTKYYSSNIIKMHQQLHF